MCDIFRVGLRFLRAVEERMVGVNLVVLLTGTTHEPCYTIHVVVVVVVVGRSLCLVLNRSTRAPCTRAEGKRIFEKINELH